MLTIKDRVFTAFRRLNIENLNINDHLELDLAMDSQEVVLLLVELDKIFQIKLNFDDINRDMTVLQVIKVIKNLGGK